MSVYLQFGLTECILEAFFLATEGHRLRAFGILAPNNKNFPYCDHIIIFILVYVSSIKFTSLSVKTFQLLLHFSSQRLFYR